MALVWIPGCSSYPVLGTVASPYFTGRDPMQIPIAWVQMVQHRPLLCVSSLVEDRARGQARSARRGWHQESEGRLKFGEGPPPLPPPYAHLWSGRALTSVDWDTLPAGGWYSDGRGGGQRDSIMWCVGESGQADCGWRVGHNPSSDRRFDSDGL